MSKGQIRNLENQFKKPGTAYLFWLFFGAHYIYMGKIGIQILYWLTLGGIGIWAIIDLFRIPGMVRAHNDTIAVKIDILESGDEKHRHLAY